MDLFQRALQNQAAMNLGRQLGIPTLLAERLLFYDRALDNLKARVEQLESDSTKPLPIDRSGPRAEHAIVKH
jgi:hypothetical protein